MSEILIHVPRKKNRNDAMFYYGQHIATCEIAGRKLVVEAAGEMVAAFTEDGEVFANSYLAKELEARGYGDKALDKLGINGLIRNNNWFRIIWQDGDDEFAIVHTYDDAINTLKNIVNTNSKRVKQ